MDFAARYSPVISETFPAIRGAPQTSGCPANGTALKRGPLRNDVAENDKMSSSKPKAARKTGTSNENGGIIPTTPTARQRPRRAAGRARIANGRASGEKASHEGLGSARHPGAELKRRSGAEQEAPKSTLVGETVARQSTPGAVDLSWAEFQKSVRSASSSSGAGNAIRIGIPLTSPTDPQLKGSNDGPGNVARIGGELSGGGECLTSEYLEGTLRTFREAAGEASNRDPKSVAFHYDRAFGIVRIERPDGRELRHEGELAGLGSIGVSMLFAAMVRLGRRITPWEMSKLLSIGGLSIQSVFAARLKCVRRAFGEGGRTGEPIAFMPSWRDPYSIAWNARFSFRVIEPVAWKSEAEQCPGAGPVAFHYVLSLARTTKS